MNPNRLNEIKMRCANATAGPWHVGEPASTMDVPYIMNDDGGILMRTTHYAGMHENAAFVANAREDVTELICEVERLRVEVQKVATSCLVLLESAINRRSW